jgi:hypothetical protein
MNWIKLTTLVMIGIDWTGSCKSNYQTITTATAPYIHYKDGPFKKNYLEMKYFFLLNKNVFTIITYEIILNYMYFLLYLHVITKFVKQ